MKKRILSLLLVLSIMLNLLPGSPVKAGDLDTTTPDVDTTYNTEQGDPVNALDFKSAYVQNAGKTDSSRGTAQKLEVVVRLKNISSTNQIYAMVMKASQYKTIFPNGPAGANLADSNYANLSGMDSTFYGISALRVDSATADSTRTIRLVPNSTTNRDNLLTNGTSVNYKDFRKATVDANGYYDEYVLIVFSLDSVANKSYYIDRFYIDAEGYVLQPSYMVRYNSNNPPGTGSVVNLPRYSSVSNVNAYVAEHGEVYNIPENVTPTRTGYKFRGWTDKPVGFLPKGGDAEAAATAAGAKLYQGGDTYPSSPQDYGIYDLYALWEVIPVKFDTSKSTMTAQITGRAFTLGGVTYTEAPVITLPNPQVGVAYLQSVALDSSSEQNSTKTYGRYGYTGSYVDSEGNTVTFTGENYASRYSLSVAADGNAKWKISGKPTNHSNGNETFDIYSVQDMSNNTYDVIWIRFDQVRKGAQPVPTLDGNTGLQSRMMSRRVTVPVEPEPTPSPTPSPTPDPEVSPSLSPSTTPDDPTVQSDTSEGDGTGDAGNTGNTGSTGSTTTVDKVVGEIYGFYSTGPEAVQDQEDNTNGYFRTDSGNQAAMDGTGTMTSYYRRQNMVYEYRPKTWNGDAVDYTAEPYSSLPTSGWRAVPTSKTAAADPTTWPESYGTIEWEGETGSEVPYVTGLVSGDVYEIRFKESTTYSESAAVEITIGGTVGGGSGPADPSDFVTVVCFDWDNTLLGSVTVPKGADASVVQGYMSTFEHSLMSTESKDFDETKTSYFVDDAAKPLTYKRGYSFLTWLPYNSELPTHCGRALDGNGGDIIVPDPAEDQIQNFGGLTENVTVKACYKDNTELYYKVDDLSGMRYTIEQTYSRVGTTGTYSISVTMKREHEIDGEIRGVPRLLDPQLRATYTIGTQSVYNFFSVTNSDVSEFTVYPSTSVNSVENVVVDFYDATTKTGAAIKSNVMTTPYNDTANPQNCFRVLGNVGLINEQLANNDVTYLNPLSMRTGASLTLSSAGYMTDRVSLRTAWEKKNSVAGDGVVLKPEKDWVGLTWNEMQIAINTQGGWSSIQPNQTPASIMTREYSVTERAATYPGGKQERMYVSEYREVRITNPGKENKKITSRLEHYEVVLSTKL